jgi:hypothetical protein
VAIARSFPYKETIFQGIDEPPDSSIIARCRDAFVFFLLIANVTIVLLETVKQVHARFFGER